MPIIKDEDLSKIEKLLNAAIIEILYGGSTDPGQSELEGATAMFKTLELLGLKIKEETDIRETLESENIYKHNYLK